MLLTNPKELPLLQTALIDLQATTHRSRLISGISGMATRTFVRVLEDGGGKLVEVDGLAAALSFRTGGVARVVDQSSSST